MRSVFLMIFFACTTLVVKGQLRAVQKKGNYSYWVHSPARTKALANKLPVLVFLHGRSLSGRDLSRVRRYGVLRAMDKGREIDAVVIAPQTANGWDADKVMRIVDDVLETQGGDPSRIYICGMSMGGYGTMDVAGKFPDRVAAAVAICGGGTLSLACGLAKVPLWIQHGNSDRIVPLSESQKIYKAIKKCDPDANATLTVIPGGTHGSVENLFHQDAMYEWLFKHKL